MTKNLERRILEMALVAFGATACGGAAHGPAESPANLPRATQVAPATTASPEAKQAAAPAAAVETSTPKAAAPAPAAPANAAPVKRVRKKADEDGCGAGSCSAKK
jgi:hypothetical protein